MKTRLPPELLDSLEGAAGYNEEQFVAVHEENVPVVSIRVNPVKFSDEATNFFPGATPVPWCSTGFYLPVRPSFTLDPLLHAGAYYVQEASSMFIEQCVRQNIPASSRQVVLDLCAAPGGKSTLLQSLISADSLLVSNEVIKSRVPVLVENIVKWGASNNIITNNDPSDFKRLPAFFDVMLIDAPCSGSGLFRRDPSAINEWSTDVVQMCSLRQQRILTDAFDALKPGGLLVYSTCSYSLQENEQICDWLIDNFPVESLPVELRPNDGIVETHSKRHSAFGYRFYPDKLGGEGFFAACFRNASTGTNNAVSAKKRMTRAGAQQVEAARSWLSQMSAVELYDHDGEILLFPSSLASELQAVQSNLYVRRAGTRVGKLMKNELVPDHELAVSQVVNSRLPSVLLKREEALQYLRKEEVTIQQGLRGWLLARYAGFNLGWIKGLGNRANNYYPKEWRILKSGNN